MCDGPTFQAYYLTIGRMIWQELSHADAKYLLSVDPEEYLKFLVEHARWEPLEWHEDLMTVELISAKTERHDPIFNQWFTVDEQRFRVRIPTSPHAQREAYFSHRPSTTWAHKAEPEWKFSGDVLVIDIDATEEALRNGVEAVRFWLGGRNKDIETGNAQLRQRIRPVWEEKRRTLQAQHGAAMAVIQNLNIPLHQDPNAKTKPVEIKPRQLRTVIEPPKPRAKPEPTLSRDDVFGLVSFVEQYARQFETAPRTYAKLEEEELRDLLIGMLNANYPGKSTGETFNKLGKTDISLRINDGHVLICECKFWSGAKAYAEALNQLFRYLTWRQNYGVMIHFCKLKDMSKAVGAAEVAVGQEGTFTSGSLRHQSETRFVSRHAHPQDAAKSVEIHHLFFDLSV